MAQVQLVPQVSSPFIFNDNQIRTVVENEQLWFVAKDICAALGISWSSATLRYVPKEWKGGIKLITPGGTQRLQGINEPAVYKLAFRSNKPEADEFTNWIAGEVVPAIRKTGKYEARQIETLTPSTPDDRAPLRALVHAWSQVCGQPHSALWPQVKAHFQLSRIDDLPVEWLPDALAFVQSKMDSWPKALPLALKELGYREKCLAVTEQLVSLRGQVFKTSENMMLVFSDPFSRAIAHDRTTGENQEFCKNMNRAIQAFWFTLHKNMETIEQLYRAYVEAETMLEKS